MKKSVLLALFLALTTSCSSQTKQLQITRQRQAVSYRLEDLCDTEISERDLTLHVYIADSERIWDYRDYKEELFGYVKEFFREQKVNCNIIHSDFNFKIFNSRNEFGVEILDSDKVLIKRYFELYPVADKGEENRKIKNLRATKGSAVTKTGLVLINGGWEEFRSYMPKEEVEKQFLEEYEGVTRKEYLLRQNAANICHEVLHCLGLFHPKTFFPDLVDNYVKGIPNIMSYAPPKFTKENKTGYILNRFQLQFIHSFLAGNNSYKRFLASDRNLDLFATNIARDNNLTLTNPVIVIPNYP